MIAVLLAGLLYWLLGAVWYSPALFANPWIRLVGLTKEKVKSTSKSEMVRAYTGTFICALVVAYGVDQLMFEMAIIGWADLFEIASTCAVAFVAATQLPSFLFLKRPLRLFLIDAGYHVCGVILCFAVLYSYRTTIIDQL